MNRLTREELEKAALDVCSANEYYELADCIDAESDGSLYEIIENN